MHTRALRYLLAVPAFGVALLLGGQSTAFAQHLDSQALGDGIELFRIRPNFYVLMGAGANVAIQVGSDGAVVVDTGDAAHADRLVAELKKLTPRPIRYLINTTADADHVGGNEKVAKAGRNLRQLGNPGANVVPAAIAAAEGALLRMSVDKYPESAWPSESFPESMNLYLNDEGIEVLHQPNAHTDADSLVFFRRSDVVMAGDIIDTRRFPMIDVANGGSISGEIAALNRIIGLAISSIPIVSREAGTVIVPGHGRLLDKIDVVEYRDMIVILRDRIEHLIKQGKSLAEVKAANPALDYRTRYGNDKGSWTTDMFVEAVFNSLTADGSKQH